MTSGDEPLAELLERARSDDAVLAVFLFGSRGWGHAVDDASDFDVGVVLRDDEALERFDRGFPHGRGGAVEVASDTLAGLGAHAAYGSPSEWARPQYLHVRLLLDRTDGEVPRLLAEKRAVPDEVRQARVPALLDTYVNAYHRSARNGLVGLDAAARLDAAESLPPFLTAIFMLERRVRPFNKHLEWELRERPLADGAWSADRLLPRLARILDGGLADQQALFRDVERAARAAGFGAVIDSWEPDVPWLRGEAAYRR